jgi:hypothetical protein
MFSRISVLQKSRKIFFIICIGVQLLSRMFRFVFSGAVSEIHLWSVPPMPMGLILSYTSRNTGLGLLYFAFEGNVNPFTGGPFGYGNNVFPSEKPESRKYFIPLIKYAIIFYETSSGCPLPVHNGRVQE